MPAHDDDDDGLDDARRLYASLHPPPRPASSSAAPLSGGTAPLVRLPSIDLGLNPVTDASGMLLPLRRGSLTDPMIHAHAHAHALGRTSNSSADVGAAEYAGMSGGRLSAGYPSNWPPPMPTAEPAHHGGMGDSNSGIDYSGYPLGKSVASSFPQQHGLSLKRKSIDREPVYAQPQQKRAPIDLANPQQAQYVFPPTAPSPLGNQSEQPTSPTIPHQHSNLSSYTFGRPPSVNNNNTSNGDAPEIQAPIPVSMVPRLAVSAHSSPDPAPYGSVKTNALDGVLPQDISDRASLVFGSGMDGDQVPSQAGKLTVPAVKETPYSRSPELKISHKMAERKRRKEMKDLFDELRDSIPSEKGIKCSKWEILSKAIEYIAKQGEEKEELQALYNESIVGMSNMENALQHSRNQIHALQTQINQLQAQQQPQQMSLSPVSSHHTISQPQQHPMQLQQQQHNGQQWSNSPVSAYGQIAHHLPQHTMPHHSRSHSHGSVLTSGSHGHTAVSAPPALPASAVPTTPSIFGTSQNGHHQDPGSIMQQQGARPPSIHSHNSNQSVHSLHSHPSASPAPNMQQQQQQHFQAPTSQHQHSLSAGHIPNLQHQHHQMGMMGPAEDFAPFNHAPVPPPLQQHASY